MANVVPNIKEMLAAVRDERAKLQERDRMLAEREKTLETWLIEEAPKQSELGLTSATPLSAFLQHMLSAKPQTTQELAEHASARRLIDEGKSPLRSVNFTLLALQNAGIVTKDGDKWALKAATH